MPFCRDPEHPKGVASEALQSSSSNMRNPAQHEGGEAKVEKAGSSSNENLRVVGMKKRVMGKGVEVRDRAELMERIKRGESPTWIPSKAVSIRHLTFQFILC